MSASEEDLAKWNIWFNILLWVFIALQFFVDPIFRYGFYLAAIYPMWYICWNAVRDFKGIKNNDVGRNNNDNL